MRRHPDLRRTVSIFCFGDTCSDAFEGLRADKPQDRPRSLAVGVWLTLRLGPGLLRKRRLLLNLIQNLRLDVFQSVVVVDQHPHGKDDRQLDAICFEQRPKGRSKPRESLEERRLGLFLLPDWILLSEELWHAEQQAAILQRLRLAVQSGKLPLLAILLESGKKVRVVTPRQAAGSHDQSNRGNRGEWNRTTHGYSPRDPIRRSCPRPGRRSRRNRSSHSPRDFIISRSFMGCRTTVTD